MMNHLKFKPLQILLFTGVTLILFSCKEDPERIINNFKLETANLEYQKAIRVLKNGFPDKFEFDHFYYYGVAHLNLGDLDSAEMNFSSAISLDSNRYEPYLRLSEVYMGRNELDLAYPCIEKANSIDPDNVNILFQFANYHSLKKNKEKTQYYFQLAADREPENAFALTNLGVFYLKNSEFDIAEKYFQKALMLKTEPHINARIDENLGLVFFSRNDLEQAKHYFYSSFNQFPKNENVNFHLGIIYAKEGGHSKAISHFTNSIRSKNSDDKTYFNRAISYYELDNFQNSISDLNRAIELNGEIAEYFVLRGQVKITIGQNDEGCNDFQKAKALGFKNIKAAINEFCL